MSEVSDEDLSVRMKSLLRNTLRTRKRLERASDAFDDPPPSRSSSLTAGPSLGGRVTHAGRGVEGVMVRAVDEEGVWLRTVLTDAQGYYSLPVSRADAMTVSTVNHQGLVDQTRRASPSTQTIEFALAAGGTLSGTVLETGTLAPAANAAVFVLEMTQILGPDTLTSVATAFTAADGTF
ncbi:MAG: carboxypeptidase-like regulatory domain-containing protein, partial [Acidobacteriota bacterium]